MSKFTQPIPVHAVDLNDLTSESCSFDTNYIPMDFSIPSRGKSPIGFDDSSLPVSNSGSRVGSRVCSRRTDVMSPLDFFGSGNMAMREDLFIFR
ncbi:hypothetical protein EIN_113850 [Entamoeba invadens IP1]|uniref:Uncharacterized protein n=1 Tax=Entamoeba invadens IP1 TaxID=370355 RepID=A0A0A1U177_ENTIV|nr:hypothetical protein EIN_113850 [Entamoeba invadens IP1]ELP86261.1 hypothetical protein EIN_113850 [Entamoeba invadens IP1]|eukprot:XP_004185607.1 hypothetical protein EIN_113850 [Entamoeba invadens IP1]